MNEGYQPLEENEEGQMVRRRNESAGDLGWREYQVWEDWEQQGEEVEGEEGDLRERG